MITLDLLRALCSKTPVATLEQFVEPLDDTCTYYEINTTQRVAAFLAQVAHESGSFIFTQENLNYSAKGLRGIFGKYFPNDDIANQYQRQPEMIANRVYANRMGNGNETSGDGWKFRGRGLIQLTGKNNYTLFANSLGLSVEDCVKYMSTVEGATASAGWFWNSNDLNKYADNGDIAMLTRLINGGNLGLDDRVHHYEMALGLLRT